MLSAPQSVPPLHGNGRAPPPPARMQATDGCRSSSESNVVCMLNTARHSLLPASTGRTMWMKEYIPVPACGACCKTTIMRFMTFNEVGARSASAIAQYNTVSVALQALLCGRHCGTHLPVRARSDPWQPSGFGRNPPRACCCGAGQGQRERQERRHHKDTCSLWSLSFIATLSPVGFRHVSACSTSWNLTVRGAHRDRNLEGQKA